MATVLHRTTKLLIYSVNTPDYPAAIWIINPNLTSVAGVPAQYWKIVGDTISEMSKNEKRDVDAALLPDIKKARKEYLHGQSDEMLNSLGYSEPVQRSYVRQYTDAKDEKGHKASKLKPWMGWYAKIDNELDIKYKVIDGATNEAAVNAVQFNFGLTSEDPHLSLTGAMGVTGDSELSSFLDTQAIVKDPETGISGAFLPMQILLQRDDMYNDPENPLYHNSKSPILGPSGILVDHANRVLNLETIHGKLGWHNQQIQKASYRRPRDLLVYYGWLNSFNSDVNGWDNEKVAQDMAKYSLLVLGDGVQNPSHGDYANTQIIIARVKQLNPNASIFGYVAAAQTIANFKTKVDQWNTLQVHGIFIDEAGYDFGKTRAEFNEMVDYVHDRTYSKLCFVNAWNTDHVLGTANDPSYPNSTYNPTLVASRLTSLDWTLLESFPINTTAYTTGDGYEPRTQWATRDVKATNLRATYGTNMAALCVIANGATSSGSTGGASLFDFAFTSALEFSLDGLGSSDTNYAASSAKVKHWTRPDVSKLGSIWTLNPSVQQDVNDKEVYHRFGEDAVKLTLDFSPDAQLSSITKF